MKQYIQSYIKSIKYIKALIQFNEDKIEDLYFNDETYKGLDGNDTMLRVFMLKK